jgi:hypothetical protein
MTDQVSTWIAPVGAAVAFIVGVVQFAITTAQKNREPFLKKQLELCCLASETAAQLATETDPVEWEKARKQFWRLYWGQLGIVEDEKVESAMVILGNLVPIVPEPPRLPMSELKSGSLALAHAARDLMAESWKVRLLPLPGKTRS